MHKVYDKDHDEESPDTIGDLKRLWKDMRLDDNTKIRFVDEDGRMTNQCIGSMYYSERPIGYNPSIQKAFFGDKKYTPGVIYIQLDDFTNGVDMSDDSEEDDPLIG